MTSKGIQCNLEKYCSQCDLLAMAGLGSQCANCHWKYLGVQPSAYDLLLCENISLARIAQAVHMRVRGYPRDLAGGYKRPAMRPRYAYVGNLRHTPNEYINHQSMDGLYGGVSHHIGNESLDPSARKIPCLMDIETRAPPLSFGPLPLYTQRRALPERSWSV